MHRVIDDARGSGLVLMDIADALFAVRPVPFCGSFF
jgi:hypothetical protein